jgi:hypothetical protein
MREKNSPSVQDIERRAYELYELRGRQDGYDKVDWFEAERELTTIEEPEQEAPKAQAAVANRGMR